MAPSFQIQNDLIRHVKSQQNTKFVVERNNFTSWAVNTFERQLRSVMQKDKRHALISMRTSEGREALCLQSGGQDIALSCFFLGVFIWPCLTSSTTALSASTESRATGLPRAFFTRSYLLFHSRLISALKRKK